MRCLCVRTTSLSENSWAGWASQNAPSAAFVYQKVSECNVSMHSNILGLNTLSTQKCRTTKQNAKLAQTRNPISQGKLYVFRIRNKTAHEGCQRNSKQKLKKTQYSVAKHNENVTRNHRVFQQPLFFTVISCRPDLKK